MAPKVPRRVSKDVAEGNPLEHVLVPGKGFFHVGPPAPTLPRPGEVIASRETCEPPAPASDGSWHLLVPPARYGDASVKMRWSASRRCWSSELGKGNRLAFSSQHLASAGWTYGEPTVRG